MAIRKLAAQDNNARKPRLTGKMKERAFSAWHSRRPSNVKRFAKRYKSLAENTDKISRDTLNEISRRVPGIGIKSRHDLLDGKTTINIKFPADLDVGLAKKTLNYINARNERLNAMTDDMQKFNRLIESEFHTAKGERRKAAQRAMAEIKKTNSKGPGIARGELGAIMTTFAQFVANARTPYGTKVSTEMRYH